ncbi:LysR family transcriptional regulator [Parasphingorhabdus sp.]|uniref:LysR family transcriptional regulator n=1 Tax=Parasphingorhabdus sp. TaxID=2709688 RepID=UPI003C77FC3B
MAYRQFEINIQDLQTFAAVAECESFSEAAKSLGKTQPSVSNRIKLLEEKLQRQLILRDNKSVSLTDEGRRFQEYASKLITEMAVLHDEFHAKSKQRQSTVRLSLPMMIGTAMIGSVIEQFHQQHPNIKIILEDDTRENCVQHVIDGKSHLAFISSSAIPENVDYKAVASRNCYAITSHDHPLAKNKAASFAEILKYPVLSPDIHMDLRREIQAEAEQRGIKVSLAPEASGVTSYFSLLAMAASGQGVAILTSTLIPPSFMSILGITEIADCQFTRTFGLVTAKGRKLSPSAKLFRDYLVKVGEQIESERQSTVDSS